MEVFRKQELTLDSRLVGDAAAPLSLQHPVYRLRTLNWSCSLSAVNNNFWREFKQVFGPFFVLMWSTLACTWPF